MPNVYLIRFSNNKIYIGSDMTDTVRYLGSFKNELLHKDFQIANNAIFEFKKEILYYSETVDRDELLRIESEFIAKYDSTNPKIGYNIKK